jgi:hypothetical protein
MPPTPIGYVPPTSEKFRITLLVKVKKRWINSRCLLNHHGPYYGLVLLLMDEWMDPTCHALNNFMVLSKKGLVYLKAIYALGKYKDAHYIGESFSKFTKAMDVNSCVQIITDNSLVRKVVDMIMETKYPQIFWTTCIV